MNLILYYLNIYLFEVTMSVLINRLTGLQSQTSNTTKYTNVVYLLLVAII